MILPFAAFSVFFSSCNYNLFEVAYRKDSVRERAENLVVFDSTTEIKAPSVSKSKYSVVFLTDVHFGSSAERKDEEF